MNGKQLFQFLKEFNRLKTKPLLDIKSYEDTLWLSDIPVEKECESIIHPTSSEHLKLNQWLKLKKAKRWPCPDPPEQIHSWIKNNSWKNHTKPPSLFSYRLASSEDEDDNSKILLEDNPHIKLAFEDYMEQKWQPWAKEEARLAPILKVYHRLYNIYSKIKDQGENYQLVLGLGFLSAKNKKGAAIKRHIVTSPLSIDFDSKSGSITIPATEQILELSLETDFLEESEKPSNSDTIDSQLSALGDDFWKPEEREEFYSLLKSWINSYDHRGQFYPNFEKPDFKEEFSTLTVSPAIILRKRNEKSFIKFYDSAIKKLETEPLQTQLIKEQNIDFEENNISENQTEKPSLKGKYYLPLPQNEEQLKIMKQILDNNQVVVKGPPGTGKTHSIANLICHFLSQGKKILITSQTDRALKVLKSKLPSSLQALCVEILGRDHTSFQKLQECFSIIYNNYQDYNPDNSNESIKKLEKKDNKLKGEIASIKSKLLEIKLSETTEYTKKFKSYSGTLAKIADKLKSEESKYQWIKEFNFEGMCPVSNDEALSFLNIAEKLKYMEDSFLKEPVEFLNQIFSLKQLEDKLEDRENTLKIIDKHKGFESEATNSIFLKLKEEDFNKTHQGIIDLLFKMEACLNRKEEWLERALKDCLLSKAEEWEILHHSTIKLLDENKDRFPLAEKIKNIKLSGEILTKELSSNPKLIDLYLSNMLNDFFKEHESDNIKWGFFAPKTVKNLKKIKIDGKKISCYEDVKKLDNYIKAKNSLEEINNLWKRQNIDINTKSKDFSKNSRIFKNFCLLLEECLFVYNQVEEIKKTLKTYNIPTPYWKDIKTIEKQKNIMDFIRSQNKLDKIDEDFKEKISHLKKYENQENQLAKKFILALENKDPSKYESTLKELGFFKDKKEDFKKLCQIGDKFKNKTFYKKLRKNTDKPLWQGRLKSFEEAWLWKEADQWLKNQGSEDFFKKLNQQKEELLTNIQHNMEELVAQKTWDSCLSKITNKELSALDGFAKSIKKIGKGTGKTASKHRRIAKKRMEECRSSIPAWIMPLYRVVENIHPPSPQNKPFDIVIIDEASQTGPDGLLLDYLAEKIVVVGDEEQISPENIGVGDEDVEILKKKYLSDINSDYIGKEYSYYDYCSNKFAGTRIQLREHFRCMPEIIKFSNELSYRGTPLIPLRRYGSSRLDPLKTTYVEDAVSKVGGGKFPQNEKEAQEITNTIRQCIDDIKYKDKTFGVIVLQGKDQIQLIDSALSGIDKTEMEKRDLRVGNAYDFQGDERDVIFLSMAIAKDWNKRARTGERDKKQYNVAVSRAKDQIWLFHSVESHELSKDDFRRKLLDHCKTDLQTMTVWPQAKLQELYEKIKETPNKHHDNAPKPFDSWFEARVFYKIAMRGFHVIPQYEGAGYRMDMIISGQKSRLAVECDGDYWHGGEEQQRKDMERQWNLETCGWTFWRLRESLFNRGEEEALKSLWELLDQMEIKSLSSKPEQDNKNLNPASQEDKSMTDDKDPIISSQQEQDRQSLNCNEPMTDEQIKGLILTGEGYRTEFKQALDKSLIREVCAFANSSGGRILLGVADDNSIKGIDVNNRFLSEVQDILNKLEPKLDIVMETRTIDGKSILVICVPEGHEKPYTCPKGFCIRVGANSQKMTRNKIIASFQKEGRIKFEELINLKADFKTDFNPQAFDHFLELSGISPKALKQETLLQNLDCLTKDKKLTNLGVLFFTKNIDFTMNHALVDCILFKGTSRVKILDRKQYKGPLIENIESALAFIQRHTKIEYVITGQAKREEIPDYPEPALREAVINAACHRDYFDKGGHVVVEVFSNRVKICNPGGLPSGLDPESFGTKSIPRNPRIASMLQRAKYIEKAGTGIARIKEACSTHLKKIKLDIQHDNSSCCITFKKDN